MGQTHGIFGIVVENFASETHFYRPHAKTQSEVKVSMKSCNHTVNLHCYFSRFRASEYFLNISRLNPKCNSPSSIVRDSYTNIIFEILQGILEIINLFSQLRSGRDGRALLVRP